MEETQPQPKRKFSRLPRPLRILMVMAVVVGGLLVLRLAIGLGTAAIHYGKTPTFAEYIASHPVDDGEIEKRLPEGELIEKGTSWSIGPVDPLELEPGEGEFARFDLTLKIDVTREDESLLEFSEEFSVAMRRDDWSHHGVHAEVTSMKTAPGLRAIVVTSLSDPEKMVGEESMAKGGAIVDLFLVSGEGPSESRYQWYPGGNVWAGGPGNDSLEISLPTWRIITGITHNTQPLPEEGLIHHFRQRMTFDWRKYENGHGGPSRSFLNYRANTDEYSRSIQVTQESAKEGKSSGNQESSRSYRRTWNGELW